MLLKSGMSRDVLKTPCYALVINAPRIMNTNEDCENNYEFILIYLKQNRVINTENLTSKHVKKSVENVDDIYHFIFSKTTKNVKKTRS